MRDTSQPTRRAAEEARRTRLILFAFLIGLTFLAWLNRFIQDDAFISFRYARNLVQGEGLVFNAGERVEGYTNFLYTVLMAVPIALRIDPVIASWALGLVLFPVTLWLTYRVADRVIGSRRWALVAVALLGTNYTFSAYATGGLETQLHVMLLTASLLLAIRIAELGPTWSGLGGLSLVAAAALMTRLDSALILAFTGGGAAWVVVRWERPVRTRLARIALLAGPLLLLVGGWLAWKLAYYGGILPNTFDLRIQPDAPIFPGLYYLYVFSLSYLLIPLLPIALFSVDALGRAPGWPAFLAALVATWCAYVVRVGGDFMEFRLLVPVLPVLFVMITWLIARVVRQRRLQLALIALVLAGSYHHYETFDQYTEAGQIDSIAELSGHVESATGKNWRSVGEALGAAFGPDADVLIAVTFAGAIPYYSGLPAIDMLGVNDAWIAAHGRVAGTKPGHTRQAPLSYLMRRGTNLVIGQPLVRHGGPVPTEMVTYGKAAAHRIIPDPERLLPADARIIEMPLGAGQWLAMLYLTPSAAVDTVVRARGWRVFDIEDVGPPAHMR